MSMVYSDCRPLFSKNAGTKNWIHKCLRDLKVTISIYKLQLRFSESCLERMRREASERDICQPPVHVKNFSSFDFIISKRLQSLSIIDSTITIRIWSLGSIYQSSLTPSEKQRGLSNHFNRAFHLSYPLRFNPQQQWKINISRNLKSYYQTEHWNEAWGEKRRRSKWAHGCNLSWTWSRHIDIGLWKSTGFLNVKLKGIIEAYEWEIITTIKWNKKDFLNSIHPQVIKHFSKL